MCLFLKITFFPRFSKSINFYLYFSVIDPSLLSRLQSMVDTLTHTRVLQQQLNESQTQHRSYQENTTKCFNGLDIHSDGRRNISEVCVC